jgi:nucleoside triphosphate diphosphatase
MSSRPRCTRTIPERRNDEFGDFLFALVNYARVLHVNPENALRSTTEKFIRRFHFIEEQLKALGKTPEDSSLEEMDGLWNEAKRPEGVTTGTRYFAPEAAGACLPLWYLS